MNIETGEAKTKGSERLGEEKGRAKWRNWSVGEESMFIWPISGIVAVSQVEVLGGVFGQPSPKHCSRY